MINNREYFEQRLCTKWEENPKIDKITINDIQRTYNVVKKYNKNLKLIFKYNPPEKIINYLNKKKIIFEIDPNLVDTIIPSASWHDSYYFDNKLIYFEEHEKEVKIFIPIHLGIKLPSFTNLKDFTKFMIDWDITITQTNYFIERFKGKNAKIKIILEENPPAWLNKIASERKIEIDINPSLFRKIDLESKKRNKETKERRLIV